MFNCAVGREEHCKQISLAWMGSAPSVSGTLGLPLAHRMCAFPVYTVQALGCCAETCLRWTLGCMPFPGLSHSGDHDQAFGDCGRSYLLPLPSLLLSFLGVQPAYLLRRILTIQNPKKTWLATKPACSILSRRIPGTEKPGGLPSKGSHRVGND